MSAIGGVSFGTIDCRDRYGWLVLPRKQAGLDFRIGSGDRVSLLLRMSFQPIENYGVIGNMRSIALVGMDGSIDFLCYPEFDSPTVFAALLDDEKGGRFQIEPQLPNVRIRQLYLPDTNILVTRFLAEEGVAELTDFMPIERDAEQPNEIIRMACVIRGNGKLQNALPAEI
jgi:GH15 family glucan-1,4-alpha-glucosidase